MSNEAECHRPAPRLWAAFSCARSCGQYQDKYAIFHLEFENYPFALTLGEKSVGLSELWAFTKN